MRLNLCSEEIACRACQRILLFYNCLHQIAGSRSIFDRIAASSELFFVYENKIACEGQIYKRIRTVDPDFACNDERVTKIVRLIG